MKFLKLKSGFTLVELMVVVAIIGILSAVAIPNFKKYQAKSKSSEAKLHLAAIYTAEQAFSSDYDTYATCLQTMGYDPDPESNQRYYATGFGAAHATGAGNPGGGAGIAQVNGATSCGVAVANLRFDAGKNLGSTAAIGAAAGIGADVGKLVAANLTAVEAGFLAAASGFIHPDFNVVGTADQWTISETKQINHVQVGY